LAHCLILDVCTITHLFAEIANRLEYHVAAKANTPISDKVYDTPCACANAIATKLNNVLPTMQLEEYTTAPFTFALFRPLKTETDKPAGKKPNPRAEGDHPPNKKLKAGGLLVFSGTGKLPTWNNISEPHAKTGKLTRLCSNFAMQGRTCRWGDECTFVHLKRVDDLQPKNQKLFKTEVNNNPKLRAGTTTTTATVINHTTHCSHPYI
jgi:hypothetical protein